MRPLVGEWCDQESAPGDQRSVVLQLGLRSGDGRIAIAVREPSLDEDAGSPLGVLLLSAAEAAQLVNRVIHGLDQSGHGQAVERGLEARARALQRSRPRARTRIRR